MKGHSEIVKLLLVAGARDITDKVEHYTRKFNYISSELIIIDESLSMMIMNDYYYCCCCCCFQFGNTGLSKARTNNHIEVVRLLQQPM